MGNIVTTIKRFLANKNTVTILGVLLGLIVLIVAYNYRINNAVDTVSVPYAKRTLAANTTITSDMVGTMNVLRSNINESKTLISSMSQIVNTSDAYCVSERTIIPQGSFFYQDQVTLCRNNKRNVLDDMPDGYNAVSIPVTLQSTLGNSLSPGDYIDLYVRTTVDGKLAYAPFITKLPILDVRDSNGDSLFYGATTSKTPALLLFAVPNYDENGRNLYLILAKATMLNNITLVPIPGNRKYTSEVGETRIQSDYIYDLIENLTANIPDSNIPNVSG